MTEFRVPMRNVVLSQHWPPLTLKDIHTYNYTKKNSVCRCAMLCSHNIDPFWHWESAKMSPSTVTHCYSEYSLLGTSYSEFHSLPDIDFAYTRLYLALGPRGKHPKLKSQLTSKAASSRKTQILVFSSRNVGFLPDLALDPYLGLWPSLSGSLPAISRSLSPLAYKTHTTCDCRNQ